MAFNQKKYFKKWCAKNSDKRIAANYRYWKKNPIKRIYWGIRRKCRILGIPFDIKESDIVIPDKCPYLGLKLEHTLGIGHRRYGVSVDRIDPSLGYVKGNIQVISRMANMMKQDATLDQLIMFSESVLRLHKKTLP